MKKLIVGVLILFSLIACNDSFNYSSNKTRFEKGIEYGYMNQINVNSDKKIRIECLINLTNEPVEISIINPNGVIETIICKNIGINEIHKEFENIKGNWAIELRGKENNTMAIYKIHTRNRFEKFSEEDYEFVNNLPQ